MSNDKSYNGYTNYETWNCSLWIDNDSYLQEHYSNIALEFLGSYDKDDAILKLMDYIKDEIEENNPLKDKANMYSDLMNASISEINFYEIAENFINEVYEENKEESD